MSFLLQAFIDVEILCRRNSPIGLWEETIWFKFIHRKYCEPKATLQRNILRNDEAIR